MDYACAAQELYSPSPTFQKTLVYGKSLKPDAMFILSAKYHLVPLNKELAPYDLTLKEMPKEEKEKWGREVIKQLQAKNISPTKNKFIFLTGAEYMKPLLKYIPESNIETPLEGKRMGERMEWLNAQINNLKAAIKMGATKIELQKMITLYLNDIEDYGTPEEFELAESLLAPYRQNPTKLSQVNPVKVKQKESTMDVIFRLTQK
jgi:hypothetical protein